jgi:hypothetical protein
MLKKLLVALVASAFALGAYAQTPAPKDDTKGKGEMKSEAKKSDKAKAKSKSSSAKANKKTAKADSKKAKAEKKDAAK